MTRSSFALLGSLGLLLVGCGSSPEPRTSSHAAALRHAEPGPTQQTEQAAGYRAELETPQAMTAKERALAEKVLDRLRQHPYAGSAMIAVSVRRGLVELVGTVSNDLQRRSAEQVALQVEGVERVNNRLQVAPAEEAQRSDRLEQALQLELQKAGVAPELLDLQIEQGVVTVRGRLPDWDTYDRAMVAIYRAGPIRVNDELRVTVKTAERAEFVVPEEPTTASDRPSPPRAPERGESAPSAEPPADETNAPAEDDL